MNMATLEYLGGFFVSLPESKCARVAAPSILAREHNLDQIRALASGWYRLLVHEQTSP